MKVILANDLSLYETNANEWWNEHGRFAGTLHGVNELRLKQITDEIGRDLRGMRIVDLGCGGGLISEPLARRGAAVIGIDMSRASIAAARMHGADIANLDYRIGDVRSPNIDAQSVDAVMCADLLEHIPDWEHVLESAFTMLRPGGRCYCSTLNKTWLASLLAVQFAERFGLIPRGTHDHKFFITPQSLISVAQKCGFSAGPVLGQRLRLWRTIREWRVRVTAGKSDRIAYSMWLYRPC